MNSGPNQAGTKLVYFGNERLISGLSHTDAPVLRGLITRGYDICAVVSHHHETNSRSSKPLEVGEIAAEHGIPLLLPNKPLDISEQLRSYGAEAGILVAYGRIISQTVIDIFPKGIINIHPSLLPKWRGPSPIESPIYYGDAETGVSLMQLTAGMDEGPVYAQARVQLEGTETKQSLYETLTDKSSQLLFESLPGILNGDIEPVAQNHSDATYSYLLSKTDAFLNTSELSAAAAERKVRAHLSFPKTKISIDGKTLIILSGHVSESSPNLGVECADGKYLAIDSLIAPNGKSMSAEAYLRGQQR